MMKWTVMLLLVISIGCKKENRTAYCTEPGYVNATIINGGAVEVDGCDWLVRIGETNYHPDKLAPSFKQDGLAVKICYEDSNDKFVCGIAALNIPVIHIVDIRK